MRRLGWRPLAGAVLVATLVLAQTVSGHGIEHPTSPSKASNSRNATSLMGGVGDGQQSDSRRTMMIMTSLGIMTGAIVIVFYCCCGACKDRPNPNQNQLTIQERAQATIGVFPRASFYAPPPRYSVLVRSQSQRRARLTALQRAAVTSLPRYSDAVKQLEVEEALGTTTQQGTSVILRIPDMASEVADVTDVTEVTETLLSHNMSADDGTAHDIAVPVGEPLPPSSATAGTTTTTTSTTTSAAVATASPTDSGQGTRGMAVSENLCSVTDGRRALFHSTDSLLAAETSVALEDELDSNLGPDSRGRSASCGDLLDSLESNRVVLRTAHLLPRSNSPPPRYSEILEKSKPKSGSSSSFFQQEGHGAGLNSTFL